ncbi:hypothetical protein L207DRAFT_593226 [Hyaloscypha variabilis F]|uniref:DUF6594 domain-containing protein n=1 Tax=Hyaloscypha variabilis (strain UAMH 11265 / GT02V1 / F) TaxID=1149755 RepID=A0A2J6QTS1_HYAVF|nr:hypothetical protein L207DRAFT_593226 [Hyaloscypha variabilis F]
MTELADFNSTAENYNASPQSEGQPNNLLESFESLGSSPGEASGTSTRSSSESQVLTLQEVDEKPWKYIGYQGYSKVLSSDTDFLVFRRFGAINARSLLRLQDRVVILEEALEELDRKLKRRETPNIHNGWFRQDYEGREMVLDNIQIALSEYNVFLLQQGELSRQYPTAPPHAIKSLLNWHANHNNGAIETEEQRYLTKKHDLISLVPKSITPLERLLESSGWFKLHLIWKDKDVPELPLYDTNVVTLFSDGKIDRFIAVVITALGTLMLVVPLWVLPNLEDMNAKLGTITAFVVVFLGLVAYTTTAKPFETLAATAAYAAVLTVFLQLGKINSP